MRIHKKQKKGGVSEDRSIIAGEGAEWFREAFGVLYPMIYAHRDVRSAAGEIKDLMGLLGIRSKDIRLLDLACGSGRHGLALHELGYRTVGLDLSPNLLADAHRHRELRGRLVRGDMRNLPFQTSFDLVLSLFTSFGYFLDEAENQKTLVEMCSILKPGGILVIDHINRPYLETNLVTADSRRGPDCTIHQTRTIESGRIQKRITINWDKGTSRTIVESVRLYDPDELSFLLKDAGMQRIRFMGSYAGARLDDHMPRMIAVAIRGNPGET